MPTEAKIIKLIDSAVHTRAASVEQVGSQGALIVKAVGITPSTPVDVSTNSSLTLGYTDGSLTTLTKVIDSTSYTKTLTYTEGVLTNISAWVEVE